MGWLHFVWPGCIFRNLTGAPCPACGTIRAILLALRGDFFSSLSTNPYGLLSLLVLLSANIWLAYDLVKRRDTISPALGGLECYLKRHRGLVLLLLLLAIGLWVYRIWG